jgi:ubiquinone/menaquinone biosynthesis C-methylase UbiE
MDHRKLNDEKWTKRSTTYDDRKYDFMRLMQEELIRKMIIKEWFTFLDIGCGTGWALFHLHAKLNGNGTFYGVDISEGMIVKAIEKIGEAKNIQFVKADAMELPFPNDSIDRVLCTNSFHHYSEPQKTINEVYRVLKRGGSIYLMDATRDSLFMRIVNKGVKHIEKEHVCFYSSKEMEKMYLKAQLRYRKEKLGCFRYPMKIHVGEKES